MNVAMPAPALRPADQVRVLIDGNGVGAVCEAAWELHTALCAGSFSAVVDATAGRWLNPDAARAAFDAAARDANIAQSVSVDGTLEATGADHVSYTGRLGALSCAVEAWERAQLGQLDHLAVTYACSWPLGDEFSRLRVKHARHGAWPEHPRASWGIHSPDVPAGARIAYDIWKLLGCGIPERGLICPTGTVVVYIDGSPAAIG